MCEQKVRSGLVGVLAADVKIDLTSELAEGLVQVELPQSAEVVSRIGVGEANADARAGLIRKLGVPLVQQFTDTLRRNAGRSVKECIIGLAVSPSLLACTNARAEK